MTIGVDVGGTKILAGVVDEAGAVVARQKVRVTEPGNKPVRDAIVGAIGTAVERAGIGNESIEAIGLGIPGPIDRERGVVILTPNLGLRDFAIAAEIGREFGCHVALENDVNAGLWGEYVAGAARGYRTVVGVFVGTGIGGALILEGRLYRGARGAAGEVGHMTIQTDGRRCSCGNRGCLEALASRTAIARDLALLAFNGQSPTLAEAGATDLREIRSGIIEKAWDSGEPAVREVIEQASTYLGVGLANLVNAFNPDVLVVGGGLIDRMGDRMLAVADAEMRRRVTTGLADRVPLVAATLGSAAAVVGAAALAARDRELAEG